MSEEEVEEGLEVYKQQITRWRRLWAGTFAALFFTLSGLVVILFQLDDAAETRDKEIAGINRTLQIIEETQSPERALERQETIREILVTVDCSNRQAMQELVDQLTEALQFDQDIRLIKPECANA